MLANQNCGSLFTKEPHFFSQDKSNIIERRIKILTSGLRNHAVETMDAADIKIDTADPSLIMPVTYPNGEIRYRIEFSGMRYIESAYPQDFFRGGIFHVQRSRGFYADGTEMTGPYHKSSWPWDVVIYTNISGEQIAYGGVMEQPAAHQLPNMSHNPTRSRWWGRVKHVRLPSGNFEEHIIWQGPLHDFNRRARNGWVGHGYGGTLLSKFNSTKGFHEPVRLSNGNFLLLYERVTEERLNSESKPLPWVTTMFAREITPDMKTAVGHEFETMTMRSEVTGDYFAATRRGTHENPEGYLAEGGNVLMDLQSQRLIRAWSGNDYVRRYGIFLDYLPPGADPRGLFKSVTDSNGELIDFADILGLRDRLNATWLGRPQLEYAPDGKLWLKFHFVPKDSIPDGFPHEGWPSSEEYLYYGRISAIAPVQLSIDERGQPQLELDEN